MVLGVNFTSETVLGFEMRRRKDDITLTTNLAIRVKYGTSTEINAKLV